MNYDTLTKKQLIDRLKTEESIRRDLEQHGFASTDDERFLRELHVHEMELERQNQTLRDAQGQLEDSRSRYADLYDFAPIAYATFDRNGFVLEINLTGAALLGRDRSWIIGRPFVELVQLADPDSFLAHIRSSLESPTRVVNEITFSNERGAFEFQLVSAAVRRVDGASRSCRTAFLDITQHRLAEREARAAHASEKALRGRLEGIDRASAMVSAAVAKLSGPEIRDFLQVIVDQARELVHARYAALGVGGRGGRKFDPWVFSGISSQQAACIARTPRGVGVLGVVIHAGRPIRLSDLREHGSYCGVPANHPPMTSFLALPVRYQDQVRGHLFLADKEGGAEFTEEDQIFVEMLAERAGIAMEIARLRQMEAREHTRLEFLANAGLLLAESLDYEKTLSAIAQLLVPAIADLSTVAFVQEDGGLRKVAVYHPDPVKQALLDRLKGTTSADCVPEDTRTAIETARPQRCDLTPEFLKSGMTDFEYRQILARIGATCAISVPLVLRGRVIGLLRLAMAESGRRYSDEDVALAAEIAHHAALAIDNARLYRSAQSAIRARDNLLAVVSHDLRNYLTTLRMSADLLFATSHTGLIDSGNRQLGAIRRCAARMEQLIKSLRDATMIETGHLTIEKKTEDVATLLDEAFNTLESHVNAAARRLKMEVPRDLPSVHCDRERVLQVITNLVGNAIKFTQKDGEITIAATTIDEEAVRISVSDTGTGVPDGQLHLVFNQYWKAQHSRNSTGLGLYIAKGIVQAHGGKIWVESKVGIGSTFFFTLPTLYSENDQHLPPDIALESDPCAWGIRA